MRRLRWSAGRIGLPLAVALAACAPDAAERTPETEAADTASSVTAPAYVSMADLQGGVLRGRVRFTGAVPAPDTVEITADTAACGTSRVIPSVRLGEASALADAVVSLVGVASGKPWPAASASAELDQQGCRFVPHVIVLPLGDTLRVLNNDPLSHNVHTAGFDNRSVNRTQLAGASPIGLTFAAAEKIRVRCDLHPWMSAWVVVADHPYHAVTGESGRYELSRVPPGTYTLEAWHETLGTRRRTVTIEPGRTVEADFDFATEE